MSTPTPAETRATCRRLLAGPKPGGAFPRCETCGVLTHTSHWKDGAFASFCANGHETRRHPPAAPPLTIPVRAEPGLWERRDVAVPLLWDAFANLFVIGCLAGPVVLVGLAFCAWLWRWPR